MQTEKEYIIGREINALRCESTGEYSLPDYNGDVKKVLSVRTRVFPSGKFVGDELLEFSGSVGYDVMYLDSENNITHVQFSTDYEATVKINSDTYCDSDIKTSVASCNARLIGPRKFSVKSSLDSEVRISEKRVYSVGGDAFMEYEPEILSGMAMVFTPVFGEGEQRVISEEIAGLDGVIEDEVEILLCDVTAQVGAVDGTDTEASVKGNIKVHMLYKTDGGMPKSQEKIIPYSADMSFDDFEECEDVDGRIDITSLKTGINPTEDGVTLTVELAAVPKIYAKKNSRVEIISDAYIKERGSENEYSEIGYTEYVCTERNESPFFGEYLLSDADLDKIDAIVHADAVARVDSCEIIDSVAKITGEIKFSAIACQVLEDDGYSYAPVRFSLPFEQNVNINCQTHDNMHANSYVNACDVKMDATENGVAASCTLASSVSVFSARRQRCLGAAYLTDEEFLREESVVTVYYPDASETLFDIAKRFHTSTRSIAEMNRLTEAVFASASSPVGGAGVKKLLIK